MRALARNPYPLRHASALSVILVLTPGALFAGALVALHDADPRLGWLGDVTRYPWQFWGIALTGTIATAAGLADWLFHMDVMASDASPRWLDLARAFVAAYPARAPFGLVHDRLSPPDGWARVLWRIRTHHRPAQWITGRATSLRALLP